MPGVRHQEGDVARPDGGGEDLVSLLRKTGALKISDRREFRLASGEMSDHYFDLRLLCGDPDGIGAVAAALYGRIVQIRPRAVRSVGGVESGSISIAAAVSHLSGWRHRENPAANPPLSSFFVRKKPKEHGRQRLIDGMVESPAVVVEDVVTSGGSALRAVRAIRDAGHECGRLLCVVFRGSDEQEAAVRGEVELDYLFRAEDLLGRLRTA